MSCRRYSQPAPKIKQAAAQAAARKREVSVIGHLGDMVSVNFLEDARAFLQTEFRILGLDTNKKTVGGGMREAVNIEDRMVRLGQFVEGEHTENRGQRRAENRQLKGDRNERGPAIEGTAADVLRIRDCRRLRGRPPMFCGYVIAAAQY